MIDIVHCHAALQWQQRTVASFQTIHDNCLYWCTYLELTDKRRQGPPSPVDKEQDSHSRSVKVWDQPYWKTPASHDGYCIVISGISRISLPHARLQWLTIRQGLPWPLRPSPRPPSIKRGEDGCARPVVGQPCAPPRTRPSAAAWHLGCWAVRGIDSLGAPPSSSPCAYW